MLSKLTSLIKNLINKADWELYNQELESGVIDSSAPLDLQWDQMCRADLKQSIYINKRCYVYGVNNHVYL
jgi:hypothetical protein